MIAAGRRAGSVHHSIALGAIDAVDARREAGNPSWRKIGRAAAVTRACAPRSALPSSLPPCSPRRRLSGPPPQTGPLLSASSSRSTSRAGDERGAAAGGPDHRRQPARRRGRRLEPRRSAPPPRSRTRPATPTPSSSHFKASDNTELSVWSAPITAGGGTRPTITVKASGTADIGAAALEYSGLSVAAGAAAVDQTRTGDGHHGRGRRPVSSGPTPPTTAAGELAVGFYADSGFSEHPAPATRPTATRANVSPSGDMELLVQDQVLGGAGATPNPVTRTGAQHPVARRHRRVQDRRARQRPAHRARHARRAVRGRR